MDKIQVILSEEQSANLKQHVFDITKESIEEAKRVTGIDKPFLKQNEMAKYLGISVNTLKKFESYGLPTITIDGLRLYSKETAAKFLLEHQK